MPSALPRIKDLTQALPETTIERFRRDVNCCVPPEHSTRFGICVSGGADSLALLLLAHRALPDIVAATVDHDLRPESASEAAFVGSICHRIGVPHSTLSVDLTGPGNLSDRARKARYAALADWAKQNNAPYLMTAHHADDQLETMIMRLNRGSGVAGLAAIRARNGNIIRPLLQWRKTDLEMIVIACGITAADDPTNRNDKYDRARLRKKLATADWLDPVAAAHSAAALLEADDALDWASKALETTRVKETQTGLSFDPAGLPREMKRRITLSCLQRLSPAESPRGGALDRLISDLDQGKIRTMGTIKMNGSSLWHFSKAPPRRKN
jgi:tRNA(Ile)-lysidine synthase